jgi:hypothetical protein
VPSNANGNAIGWTSCANARGGVALKTRSASDFVHVRETDINAIPRRSLIAIRHALCSAQELSFGTRSVLFCALEAFQVVGLRDVLVSS